MKIYTQQIISPETAKCAVSGEFHVMKEKKMQVVTRKSDIAYCQNKLERIIKKSLTEKEEHNIGFPGGNMMKPIWADTKIWYATFEVTKKMESTPRFWNGFGIVKDLHPKKSNNIAVEINIPLNGKNKLVAGFFAASADFKTIKLYHRGRVGGGRSGIGKKAFLSWYPAETEIFEAGKHTEDEGIFVGELTSTSFIDDLSKFVHNAHIFREIGHLEKLIKQHI